MISQTKQKGFTIVELLIVIVIIGILAAISIVAYNSITQRARDTERATKAGNLAKALVNYNAENNGTWLAASDINDESTSKLKQWKDPEIPIEVLKNVRDSAPDKDHLQLELCGGSDPTGAKVTYFQEAPATGDPKNFVKVGSGC